LARNGGTRRKKCGAPLVIVIVTIVTLVAAVSVYSALRGRQAVYPLEYEDLIIQYSGEFGLDPYLVAAVVHTESGFDAQAVSHAGAVGLMQVMPQTGEWIAGKLGMENYKEEMLLDPETNIRFGCWYLHFLQERFTSGRLVLAAYNAGHNRVSGWLEDSRLSDGDELTDIPYEETERYVQKVTRAYEKYKEYYEIG
jgi:soluble lytic murein transglycosylase